jgi:Mrp family chromosome partitioning ATPase
MSQFFDALENAKRKVHLVDPSSVVEPPPGPDIHLESPEQLVSTDPGPNMENEMITLYQGITASLPHMEHRSVLFVGSRSNEGTSTIARQLARTVSLKIGKNVLLVDLDRSRPDLHVYTNLKPEANIAESDKTGDPMEDLCRMEESSLYVMPLFQKGTKSPRTIESARERGFWEPLKDRFDLIIVDTPPAMMFPDSLGIVSQVDGVILVVRAEQTRWPVALDVKEKIVSHGGNLLGMVFNDRHYYIPQWLYKRL